MRDDDDGAPVAGLVDVAERLGEPVEAPQIDAGLGLVVDGQLRVAGQNGGDLDALHLAARQRLVHLAGEVARRAQAHLREVLVAGEHGQLLAGGDVEQLLHLHAAEAGRLLEAVADALAGELHHALFQGPQGEEGLLLVLLGGKPRELLLGADAPQQGGRECAGGLGVHPHRGQAEGTAHQPPAVAEAVLHRAPWEIGLARGCAALGQGGKLQTVLPF